MLISTMASSSDAAVLAHELGHAWLRTVKGFKPAYDSYGGTVRHEWAAFQLENKGRDVLGCMGSGPFVLLPVMIGAFISPSCR